MNENKVKVFFITGIIAICLFGYGCASTKVDLMKNKTVDIEKVSYRGVRIKKVFVQKENGETTISGAVKNTGVMSVSFGHVDISIINPEGEVLTELSTSYIPSLLINRRRHPEGSRFNVSIPFIPPVGSKVLIAFHKATTKKSTTFKCDENRATLTQETI